MNTNPIKHLRIGPLVVGYRKRETPLFYDPEAEAALKDLRAQLSRGWLGRVVRRILRVESDDEGSE